jgi:hypothetical protein
MQRRRRRRLLRIVIGWSMIVAGLALGADSQELRRRRRREAGARASACALVVVVPCSCSVQTYVHTAEGRTSTLAWLDGEVGRPSDTTARCRRAADCTTISSADRCTPCNGAGREGVLERLREVAVKGVMSRFTHLRV